MIIFYCLAGQMPKGGGGGGFKWGQAKNQNLRWPRGGQIFSLEQILLLQNVLCV